MIEKKAIIDNSVLRGLYYLDLLDHLKEMYSEVLLPKQVEEEFLGISNTLEQTKRFIFLQSFISRNSSWFRQCNEYEDDLVRIFIGDNQKLDDGEAGVIIQNQVLGSEYTLLLDERHARNYAKNKSLKIHGVLHFLVALEKVFKKCEYFKSVKILKENHNSRFDDNLVLKIYEGFQITHLEF